MGLVWQVRLSSEGEGCSGQEWRKVKVWRVIGEGAGERENGEDDGVDWVFDPGFII